METKLSLREFNDFLADYRRNPNGLRLGQMFINRYIKGTSELINKLHAETNMDVATQIIYDNFVDKKENPVVSHEE